MGIIFIKCSFLLNSLHEIDITHKAFIEKFAHHYYWGEEMNLIFGCTLDDCLVLRSVALPGACTFASRRPPCPISLFDMVCSQSNYLEVHRNVASGAGMLGTLSLVWLRLWPTHSIIPIPIWSREWGFVSDEGILRPSALVGAQALAFTSGLEINT